MVWQAVAGIAGSALGAIGARKARKKQERFIKKMMADRAKRIEEAKGRFKDSRRGLMEEARATQNAAVQGAQASLMPSMVTTVGGNYLRSIYADAGRRFQEIERQTAAGLAELSMQSPYDVVDPSTIGQGLGAEYAAYGGIITGLGGLLGQFGAAEKMAMGAAGGAMKSTGSSLMTAGMKAGGLGGMVGTMAGAGMRAMGMGASGAANT